MASMIGKRWNGVVGTCVAVVLLVAAIKCSTAPVPGLNSPSASVYGLLAECPQSWASVYAPERKGGAPAATGFALVDRITNVPEFHDCQKLLISNGSRYGPLAAIFAAWELERLGMRQDSAATSMRPDPDKAIGSGTAAVTAAAGALILNLGERYQADELVIVPGYSCLYLWRAPAWRARIVSVPRDSACLKPIRPDTFATMTGELKVVVDRAPDFGRTDYPPVARWDYDATTGQQYIGIKCGQAWCEIGSRRFNPNPPYGGALATGGEKRVRRIKGWYDEQYLSLPGANGVMIPSSLKGTLIPDPLLDTYTDTDFTNGGWLPAAYVALSGSSSVYDLKLNLEMAPIGSPLSALNRIELCRGTKVKCINPMTATPQCGLPPADATTVVWWVRVTGAVTQDTIYKCITNMDHTPGGFHVPGTARWRWILKDETTWTRCIEGCCMIDNRT